MKITLPFKKMESKLHYKLNLKMSCKNMFQNIRECAEQCYFKEKNETGCLGFIRSKSTKTCYICKPVANLEILASNSTEINNNHFVYILKYKKNKSVMYLPLEGDDIKGSTVIGEGVNGTLVKKENTQVQSGKVNQGLHFRDMGRLLLVADANECINYLEKCTHGLSIALWLKPSDLSKRNAHITHGERSINIAFREYHLIETWALGQTKVISSIISQSRVFVNNWIHIIVVYDPEVGLSLYLNGILEGFISIDEEIPDNRDFQQYSFGSKINRRYPIDGILDEIKVFYESLTSSGEFKPTSL